MAESKFDKIMNMKKNVNTDSQTTVSRENKAVSMEDLWEKERAKTASEFDTEALW
ncbi:MAG: hypothetical protein MI802_06115 [Desulfobacterales bacterium]|nr:hypothetical protein [Desulfobacterales bacterium]